jgi:hypothetical protein
MSVPEEENGDEEGGCGDEDLTTLGWPRAVYDCNGGRSGNNGYGV